MIYASSGAILNLPCMLPSKLPKLLPMRLPGVLLACGCWHAHGGVLLACGCWHAHEGRQCVTQMQKGFRDGHGGRQGRVWGGEVGRMGSLFLS